MNTTIKNLEIVNYQRNGVAGTGFFTCCFESKGVRLMATFETDDESGMVDIASCRVTERDDLRSSWYGDDFAREINSELKSRNQTVNSTCQLWQSFEKAA